MIAAVVAVAAMVIGGPIGDGRDGARIAIHAGDCAAAGVAVGADGASTATVGTPVYRPWPAAECRLFD